MKIRELRDRLIVALARVAKREGLSKYIDPRAVADEFNLPRIPGQLRLLVNELENAGYAHPSYTLGGGEDGGLNLILTASGIEKAEDLAEGFPSYDYPAATMNMAIDSHADLNIVSAEIGINDSTVRKSPNRPILNFRNVRLRILVYLYNMLVQNDNDYIQVSSISKEIGVKSGISIIAIEQLFDEKQIYIETRTDLASINDIMYIDKKSSSQVCRITAEGIKIVEQMSDSEYAKYSSNLDIKLNNNIEEDRWEPILIDRSGELYKEAITKSEHALSEIESSNGYAQADPAERDAIVFAIKGTLTSVRDGSPTLQQIRAGLLAPLRFVANKFAGAAIGEAAKIAIVAIVKWIFPS